MLNRNLPDEYQLIREMFDALNPERFVPTSMDLNTLKQLVDAQPDNISPRLGSLEDLYAYVGLPIGATFTQTEVSDELYKKMRAAFSSGHFSVWRRCRELREELIQRHVIDDEPLDPYFAVLGHLQDAVRVPGAGDVQGDWADAIHHAHDHARLQNWGSTSPGTTDARYFNVANAAKRLKGRGYELIRDGHILTIEPASEAKLVTRLEALVGSLSGLNLARRIFKFIYREYDEAQERYHLVNHPQATGAGSPQIPFGYLLLLAAKHYLGTKPVANSDTNFKELIMLATDYTAVLDVQDYAPPIWRSMDAGALLPYLQQLALYDTLFRVPQIRGSDVEKIARGILRDFDFTKKYGSGWALNDVLAVISAILRTSLNQHGPHWFDVAKIEAVANGMPANIIAAVLDEALAHPKTGANTHFSKPTDAPHDGPGGREMGQTFTARPLLSSDRKTYWLLDRSVCAIGCLEAVMAVLRVGDKKFDDKLGTPIEEFLRDEFALHGMATLTGDYDDSLGEHGECDIVIETDKAVIFLEIKKKPLTRRAQAGSDAHVLLDLASSLVAAQVQAGWHEVRLRRDGYLDLNASGLVTRLELSGRQIERIAVSLMQFGSFQDRVLLKQFFEATLNVGFNAADASLNKKFKEFNDLLGEFRQQINILHAGEKELRQPFFHCWFLSVPQLLVLLDGVNDAAAFKDALWKTRHFVTGSNDFYFDYAWMRRAAANAGST